MDLTAEQWQAVKNLIPPPHTGRGRPAVDMRSLLDGILWKIRTGLPWRELPSYYPSHQTCYRYYCEWKSSAVFKAILQSLYDDLLDRAGITPFQAIENHRIILHMHHRKFMLYIAPSFLKDWSINTALLLLQIELASAVEFFVKFSKLYTKLNPDQRIKFAGLFLTFGSYKNTNDSEDRFIPLMR
jgi:transposase